jgi:DNA-3-methyladenine glycosylase II
MECCLDVLIDLAALRGMKTEGPVAHIAMVKGLRLWRAEVDLLFAEPQPDVFPPGDIALVASAAHLFALEAQPAPKALAAMALAWAPWRSLAARLLLHHWRHVTGRSTVEDL